jgi:hypothetical protein
MWAFFRQNKIDQIVPTHHDVTRLAILSAENEATSSIDCGDAIKDFAAIKSREVEI